MMRLQTNTTGAWKNYTEFDESELKTVMRTAPAVIQESHPRVALRILRADRSVHAYLRPVTCAWEVTE